MFQVSLFCLVWIRFNILYDETLVHYVFCFARLANLGWIGTSLSTWNLHFAGERDATGNWVSIEPWLHISRANKGGLFDSKIVGCHEIHCRLYRRAAQTSTCSWHLFKAIFGNFGWYAIFLFAPKRSSKFINETTLHNRAAKVDCKRSRLHGLRWGVTSKYYKNLSEPKEIFNVTLSDTQPLSAAPHIGMMVVLEYV